MVIVFQLVVGNSITTRPLITYIGAVMEAVALLSWFAGWIAVAVNIRTEACVQGFASCGALRVATVFGAFEWLLFMVSAYLNVEEVFSGWRRRSTPT